MKNLRILWLAALVASCREGQPTPRPDDQLSTPGADDQALRGRRIFHLRVDDAAGAWAFFLEVHRDGDTLLLRQANVLTRCGTSETRRWRSGATQSYRQTIRLDPQEVVLRTAAFSELDFREPNKTHFLGSVMGSDSTTRIFETSRRPVDRGLLSERDRLHVYAFLATTTRRQLFDATVDLRTDRPLSLRVNDVAAFERVNELHVRRLSTRPKNLYREILLPSDALNRAPS